MEKGLSEQEKDLLYLPAGIKICAIAAGIKMYKTIIKKKKKKHDKIVLLVKI